MPISGSAMWRGGCIILAVLFLLFPPFLSSRVIAALPQFLPNVNFFWLCYYLRIMVIHNFQICFASYKTDLLEIHAQNPAFHVLFIPGNPGNYSVSFFPSFLFFFFIFPPLLVIEGWPTTVPWRCCHWYLCAMWYALRFEHPIPSRGVGLYVMQPWEMIDGWRDWQVLFRFTLIFWSLCTSCWEEVQVWLVRYAATCSLNALPNL
mgnify:CR=1 FL=1